MVERARKIIADMAAEHRIEVVVKSITHTNDLGADLQDLCQEVYAILLGYPPDKIVDLWESGCMPFFIVRIITNQLRSKTSRFYYTYKRFRSLCNSLDGIDLPDK